MTTQLHLSIGQFSDKGRKDLNQDFHGTLIPEQPALTQKGIAIALADGISSSQVSQVAAETAVKSFLTDYYCTSDSWTVKTSAERVISAANSWLFSQTRRSEYAYDIERGYVCTFSVMVAKARAAHIFHVGDSRIYRLSGESLEQLTEDHTLHVSTEQSYLNNALGMRADIDIDYKKLDLKIGDIFILSTDGVHEHISSGSIAKIIQDNETDLDKAAELIVGEAYKQGSTDNLTIQIVRVDGLPTAEATDVLGHVNSLPLPPVLEEGQEFDGFKIIRRLHASHRSYIYLVKDLENDEIATLKIPSIDLRSEPSYLKQFMMEEWIGKRLDSPHILKTYSTKRQRNFLYVTTEFVEGQTLSQWMIDHPDPSLESVRDIIEQVSIGLRAFHRMEMLHQDLRPENIMIDQTGTVKIIDFGSAKVAGVVETGPAQQGDEMLGTIQYSAPEYFTGDVGTSRSDLFSLGVIAYQMLTGKLPYGAQVARIRTKADQRKLRYIPARETVPELPIWIDETLRKAVNKDPWSRYEVLSEFIFDLRNPNKSFLITSDTPLAERNPLLFWKSLSFILTIIIVVLLFFKH